MDAGQAEQEVCVQAAVGIRQMPGSLKQESFLVVNEDSNRLIFINKADKGLQEVCFTIDGAFSLDTGQDKLFLQQLQPLLAMVPLGYSVSLLVYETHHYGPQAEIQSFVQKVIESVLEDPSSPRSSAQCLRTISFVQIYNDGRAQDLLSPRSQALHVADLPPLGLVVEEATEIVVADSRAAIHFYLQGISLYQSCLQQSFQQKAICGNLLTITVEMEVVGRGLRRAAVRIFVFSGGDEQPCTDLFLPLSWALSALALPAEAGFVSWILKRLLEENALTFLLLCLTLPDVPGKDIQSALSLTEQVRAIAKRVAPTYWDPIEEARKRRGMIRELRTQLCFSTRMEQDSLISQLGRVIKELQVLKCQSWGRKKETSTYEIKEDTSVEIRDQIPSDMSDEGELGNHVGTQLSQDDTYQKKVITTGDCTPNVHLGQAGVQEGPTEQKPVTTATYRSRALVLNGATQAQNPLPSVQPEAQLWQKETPLLTLHVEVLQREQAEAERDLDVLHQEHQHEAETQKNHNLQVFQAYRKHAEEQMDALERRYRKLLQESLQDAVTLSTQNQQFRAQKQLSCTESATQTDFLALKQSHESHFLS